MRAQAVGNDIQISQQFLGRQVRVLRRHRVAQGFRAGEVVQRGGQARVHADQGAAVGLVLAVLVVVGRVCGQRQHGRRDRCQRVRHRQLAAQQVHLGEVVAQRHLGLARQGPAHGARTHVGIAVSVAPDPVPHAQERGDVVPFEGVLHLCVQARDLAQEGGGVVAQCVFDLVVHRQLGGAQHAGLPQLGDPGAQQFLVLVPFALGVQMVARGHQLRDGALGVQDALALHLGGVGGQHGGDPGLAQGARDVAGAQVGLVQPLHGHRQ